MNGNGYSTPLLTTTRSGASVARSYPHKPWRRISDAALWVTGELVLEKPTITQASKIFGVPASKIAAELKDLKQADPCDLAEIKPELVEPEIKPESWYETHDVSEAAWNLVDAFQNTTPSERLEAVKLIGVATVWDEFLAPAID
jgi:hypothetical protein